MPDTDGQFGVNLARREQRGHLTPDIAAAHARLASLPTVRHEQAPRVSAEMARERSLKGARTKRNRGSLKKGAQVVLDGSRPPKSRNP